MQFELNLATAQQKLRSRRRSRCRGCAGRAGLSRATALLRDDQRCPRSGYERASVRPERDDAVSPRGPTLTNRDRAAIARGAKLFGTKPIAITGVGGLNDALGVPTIQGTCTTCHDTPNVGNHSVALPIDIGLTDASRRTPDMPLYTLRNLPTGETRPTTDPGRALITGQWADIGKFKGPILRGLAARPPYFHNGFAADLDAVRRLLRRPIRDRLHRARTADLIAFLHAL